MGRRSLQASKQGIQAIKKALKSKKWSQTYLAGAVGCSRQTIWSLLQGRPTDCDVLMEVCNQLGLKQDEVTEPELLEPEPNHSEQIEALVQVARESIRPYIQERCGMMRVLDMEQPIGLNDIYTSVNILERITGRRGLNISELMQNADPEQFDRFCLGKARENRVPGLEAVEKFSKLMILGKPGAGKTTFLKHLAMQCIGGKFQSDRVPIFITLKDFAEADDKPNLLTYIERLITMPNVGAKHLDNILLLSVRSDRPNASPLNNILRAGKALILLDGVDEVREADSSRVLRQIREFYEQFSRNQFVITCRIAAREYTFVQFTEVEVSDFDHEQITDFSNKWFKSKNDPVKADKFLQQLEEDSSIHELATSPLLLTLLCLVFEDSGSFPVNRAELYENGVDVLLKKWDVKRNIERDQIYKKLSLNRKEDLLSQIAYTTFESGSYFFKKQEAKNYIYQYIQNLRHESNEQENLELDSLAVLQAIEAQHGLLTERARGIYSFSHLTFHEYFVARKIVANCNPYATDDSTLDGLAKRITENRWREVFLLVINMLPSADQLLLLMKREIDSLVAQDKKIQGFLDWIDSKSFQAKNEYYKPVAVRIFYLCLEYNYNLGLFRFDQPLELAEKFEVHFQNGPFGIGSLDFEIELYELLQISSSEWFSPQQAIKQTLDSIFQGFIINPLLEAELKQLQPDFPELPSPTEEKERFKEVWAKIRPCWVVQLRAILVRYCSLSYNWSFTEQQLDLLLEYYYANEFLFECMDSDCYVSREVRQEIEDTLLLPIADIEKRKQQYHDRS